MTLHFMGLMLRKNEKIQLIALWLINYFTKLILVIIVLSFPQRNRQSDWYWIIQVRGFPGGLANRTVLFWGTVRI